MGMVFFHVMVGAVLIVGGSAFGWRLPRRRAARRALAPSQTREAAAALARLHDLTRQVASDVDGHNSQVAEINHALTENETNDPNLIVNLMAKLIHANRQMQERLAASEDRLRQQAVEIETHAAAARTDALTTLVNRRMFDEELGRRVAEHQREGKPLALMMADIDRFKRFNDEQGHQAGDKVLRAVARTLRQTMRERDVVARFGGEEFAVILPDTNLDDAGPAGGRARQAVEAARCRFKDGEWGVTASFGVADAAGAADGAVLIACADEALYAAKAGGRNCVYLHDGRTNCRVPHDVPDGALQGQEPSNAAEASPKRRSELDVVSELKLANRTVFCQHVRHRTAEARRGGTPFSVLLMEIRPRAAADGDSQARARTAQAAAKILAPLLRDMDVLGKYAGGCFALLSPSASFVDALRIADRLRKAFSQGGCLSQDPQAGLIATVGVVQFHSKDDPVLLLKRAETALFAAIQEGLGSICGDNGERQVRLKSALQAEECPLQVL